MKFSTGNGLKREAFGRLALTAATLMLAFSARPAFAEYPVSTLATMLDRVQIEDMYADIEHRSVLPRGTFHMLLTNPIIRVSGDSATADVVWTGVVSDALKAPPRFVEQGREHDELVKLAGRWYIKHRLITADSGLPAMYEKTYKQR
jgi:hypothetical protein